MASAAAVEAKGVTKVFGAGQDAVRALDGVSVTIRENEFFTLLGPSGCGKTTLLRLIAGFDFPTEGEILLYGEDIAPLPPFKRPVNTVFQNYSLFPHMTVGQNIGFGLEMLGKPKAEVDGARRRDAAAGAHGGTAQPQDQPDFRRPAAARRAGARAGAAAQGAAAGRAAVRARLQAAQGHADRAEAAAERDRHHLHLRHPRPGRSADHVRPHRGHVEGPHPAGRHARARSTTSRRSASSPTSSARRISCKAELAGTAGGKANVRLSCGGAAIAATLPEGFAPKDKVTVVVRPEHAQIVGNGTQATLERQAGERGLFRHRHAFPRAAAGRQRVHRAPAEQPRPSRTASRRATRRASSSTTMPPRC